MSWPNQSTLSELFALGLILPPFVALLALGSWGFLVRIPRERTVAAWVRACFTIWLGSTLALGILLKLKSATDPFILVSFGHWFEAEHYGFGLSLRVDRLSGVFSALTAVIGGLIGRFSYTYMHREPGFFRFFLLLLLFTSGMNLLVLAGSIDLLFAGWELVGLSSVLLIGFFHERATPVESALRAFVTYRVFDTGLLVGAVLLHHFAHTADFESAFGAAHWPLGTSHLDAFAATVVAVPLIVGAMGKSAQFPASGWLPRAMEGPTNSSALFYGALSVHAGVYLLLRLGPLLEVSPIARVFIGAVGLATALYGSTVGRVTADAKGQLAYATMAQVGVMWVEIALGLQTIVLVHVVGHAFLRTWQLLRTPSLIHDAHHAGLKEIWHPDRRGHVLEGLLSEELRGRLYALATARFYLDDLIDLRIVQPVLALAERVRRLENRWMALLTGGPLGDENTSIAPQSAAAFSRKERAPQAGEGAPR